VSVPSPNCPAALSPQHLSTPVVVSAQLWLAATIAATPPVRPVTGTGVTCGAVLALPNYPTSFAPQHLTPPPVVSAQECPTPAATAATALDRPDTAPGVRPSVVVPFPNCPFELAPQQSAAPPVVTAQTWLAPALTDATPLVRPVTATGVTRVTVDPSPT
jgi:hypothetical protein